MNEWREVLLDVALRMVPRLLTPTRAIWIPPLVMVSVPRAFKMMVGRHAMSTVTVIRFWSVPTRASKMIRLT
jgi:hypothetical protein